MIWKDGDSTILLANVVFPVGFSISREGNISPIDVFMRGAGGAVNVVSGNEFKA